MRMINNWSHPAALRHEDLLAQCKVRHTKGSGPGGQRRNKVQTAVVVTHLPTGVSGQASEDRSQEKNRLRAVFRLRLRLAVQHRTATELDAHPTDLWRSRCRDGRIRVNPKHMDFPTLLAEALDVLFVTGFDTHTAGERLMCSPTQLVKLLKAGPAEAVVELNRRREERGMPPLK